MPAVLLSNIGSEPKSLSQLLFLTHAPTTPFISKLNVGEALGKTEHMYKVGREQGPITEATADGLPPAQVNSNNPEYEVQVRVGFFEGKAGVGKFARHKVDYAQTTTHMGKGPVKGTTSAKHLAKGIAQQLERIKWGMEQRALSDSDSAAETGTIAGKYRGAGSFISATVPSDLPFSADIKTPSAQIISAAVASVTETALEDALKARWDSTKYASELLGLLGSDLKQQVGTYNRRVPQVSNYDTVVRYDAPGVEDRMIVRGVDIYHGDFGDVEFMLSPWAPNAKRGYCFEMAQCFKHPYGPGMDREDIGKDGSGDSTVLWAMFAILFGDPRAHVKIVGS